jgi:AcrR family transcriptional regulator
VRFAPEPPSGPSPAEQAGLRSTSELLATRTEQAQALMDAAIRVMQAHGVTRRATVAEIVREAGLSNQAFYRYFASKDELVDALIDSGLRRLVGYLTHAMGKAKAPADQIRVWIRGVLSQATDPAVAAATRAVVWNAETRAMGPAAAQAQSESLAWNLLVPALEALGRADPASDAYLVGKLVFGVLAEALWAEPPPTAEEVRPVEDFCLAAIGVAPGGGRRR